MRLIPLTKNMSAIVDDSDFEWLNQWKWHSSGGYAERVDCFVDENGNHCRQKIRMHREIYKKYKALTDRYEIDHVNNNPLDNRKINLRKANRRQNGSNRNINKNNTSGYKGVVFDKSTTNAFRKWKANIVVNRKHINLGRYLTKVEAAIAYNEAASKYFGRFARINSL